MGRPIVREGSGISLGVLERSDISQLYAEFNAPDVRRYMPGREGPVALETAYRMYDSAQQDTSTMTYAVAVNALRGKESSDLAGTVALNHIDWANRRAEVVCILFRKYWEKGYGTEALSLAVMQAFGTLNLRKLTATVCRPNRASVKMLEKNGFRRAVTFTNHVYVEGEGYVDEFIYELFRKE